MILKEMHITKFRTLEEKKIEFGKYITLIAGRNGTAKTSLLGLIVQPFSFPSKNGKTIFGTSFDTDFSKIHKVSAQYDDPTSINFSLHLESGDKLPVQGRWRSSQNIAPKTQIRFVVERGRGKGGGNYTFPTIYLGLKRLFPLGEHNDNDFKPQKNIPFTDTELKFYLDTYNDIFSTKISIKNIDPVVTTHKSTLGATIENYDSKSFSAGQDNLGQIIGAIISFQRLKDQIGDNYTGGIICIDEIEATFHPIALQKLFEFLRSQAKTLNLQIVMTTHSLDLIKLAYSEEFKYITNVVYCRNQGGRVQVENNLSLLNIETDMFLQYRAPIKPDIYLLCEDDEAQIFLENIILPSTKSQVQIISTKLGAGTLDTIAKSGMKAIANLIMILDGDKKSNLDNKIIPLPGSTIPEAILYSILDKNRDNSDFWSCEEHSTDLFLGNYPICPYTYGRNKAKDFFKHIQSINKGMIEKSYKQWAEENKKAVNKFNQDLEKMIDTINKKHKKKN